MEREKHPIKCHHCGREWMTSSLNRYTNCPKRMYKVLNPNATKAEVMMAHFNLDEKGVRILDRGLATENSPRGRIVDIYFKDKKAWCEHDDSFDCKHVEYALSLPVVQEILKKKGWKLP